MKILNYILTIILIGHSIVFALPTVSGPTGLVTMPTAEILNYKEHNSAIDYQLNTDDSGSSKSFYKVNVGALENTEIGFVGGSEPDEGVFLNFKWSLTSTAERFPLRMAVGFENITSQTQSNFYLVTSKRLTADIGVHGGFKALFSDNIDVAFMAGANYAYNEKLAFIGDLNSFSESIYYVNLGSFYKLYDSSINGDFYIKSSIENIFNNGGGNANPRYINIGLCYSKIL
tara:strand:- start:826 stop:1515 length:690 start_codon:yes stop_codon:yes gene_type:complete